MLLPWNIFSIKNSYKFCLECIFSKACNSNASKMHKIGYMKSSRGSQDASRTAPDGFCLCFGRPLGLSWRHVGHFFRPKRFHDASKTIQDALQNFFARPSWPKKPPNLPRNPPYIDFKGFFIDCWSIFD